MTKVNGYFAKTVMAQEPITIAARIVAVVLTRNQTLFAKHVMEKEAGTHDHY